MGRLAVLVLAAVVALSVTLAPLTAQAQPRSRMEQFLQSTEDISRAGAFGLALIPGAQGGAAVMLGISIIAGGLRIAFYSNDRLVDSVAFVVDNLTVVPIRHVTRPLVEEAVGAFLADQVRDNLRPWLNSGTNTPRYAPTSFDPRVCTPSNPDGRASYTAAPAAGAGFLRP